jgi:hypothetical protein
MALRWIRLQYHLGARETDGETISLKLSAGRGFDLISAKGDFLWPRHIVFGNDFQGSVPV